MEDTRSREDILKENEDLKNELDHYKKVVGSIHTVCHNTFGREMLKAQEWDRKMALWNEEEE